MDDYYDNCSFDDDEFSDESDSSELISSSDEDSDIGSTLNTIYEDDENEEVDKFSEKRKKLKYTGVPFLTKFEKTRVLGVRTEQILAGSRIFVKTSSIDPYEIACEELYSKRMPLIIRRYFGTKYVDISVNDLVIL